METMETMERLQVRTDDHNCQICGSAMAHNSDVTCFDCDRRILVAIQFRMDNNMPVLVPVHQVN